MNLALPLGLAAGLLALPILALYVLKMRRREVVVGSVLLWTDAVRDLHANAPWQRLRPNVLLALQLAVLAALVLGLARPYVLRASSVAGDVVVLLDTSVLMKATDVAGTGGAPAGSRFASAKAHAGALIDALGPNDVMSLVAMAHSPRVIIAQSADHAALHAALNNLTATNETLDALPAFSLGTALARGGHKGTLEVITGAGTPLPDLQGARGLTLHVTRVGGFLRDLALIAFAAGPDGAGGETAIGRVANYGPRAARTDVELSVDGHLLDVQSATIPAGGQTDLSWPGLPASALVLQAHLTAADAFPLDDTAWAVLPHQAPRRVVLVTAENLFLQTVFALDPSVRLVSLSPTAYAARRSPPTADVTIFDGYHPAHLPAGSLLLVNPPPGTYPGFTSRPSVAVTAPADTAQDDAGLLHYVQATNIHVRTARAIRAAAWLHTSLTGGPVPLLLAGQAGDLRVAVLTFDLHDSDLPLQPDLPVLASNLLDWLAPTTALPPNLVVRPGDTVLPVALPGSRAMTIEDPTGHRVSLAPPFPAAPFAQTASPGVYTVRQSVESGTRTDLFAVNLFPASPNAAASTARSSTAAPTRLSTPPVHTAGRGPAGGPGGVPVDLSVLFAGAALALLCAEWWVASRVR